MKEYRVYVYQSKTEWYNLEGQLHREDGPAIEYSNGDKHWYQNDKRHREGGPACEYHKGDTSWYQNGKLHREDGPAFDWEDTKRWYLNGKKLTEFEFNAQQQLDKQTCDGKIVEIDGKKYKLESV